MAKFNDALKAELILTAHALADAARPVTLKYFRNPATHADNKLRDGFDPVTIADRAAEKTMRAMLAKRRPLDAILGEEFGKSDGTSGLTWVLDPIDGTRGYISGTPTWGVLIAVSTVDGPVFGIIDQPYIDERFCGGFGEHVLRGPGETRTLQTRTGVDLSDAIIFTTFPEVGTKVEERAFADLAGRAKLVRYGMDCYAYALLALGQVDLVVEAGLNPYDIQAPIAVVKAAGGIVTNWRGGPAHMGGRVIAAGSVELHAEALKILARQPE